MLSFVLLFVCFLVFALLTSCGRCFVLVVANVLANFAGGVGMRGETEGRERKRETEG